MSGPEGSSNKHCIVCAVGIFCPEHSTICIFSVDEESTLFCLYKSTEDLLMRAILSRFLYVKKAQPDPCPSCAFIVRFDNLFSYRPTDYTGMVLLSLSSIVESIFV